MAYMNQEMKAKIASLLKPVMKKFGVKGSLSVRNHSGIVLSVKSGKIDFIKNFIEVDANKSYGRPMDEDVIASIQRSGSLDVNPYWFQEHFSGDAKEFLEAAFAALKGADWYDKTDAMVDYFDTAYYVYVNIGKWKKPYVLVS